MPRNRLPRSPRLPFQPLLAEPLEPRTLLSTGPASLVMDINAVPVFSDPAHLIRFGNAMMFRADDGIHGNEWFRTDGTADGTSLLRDINPGAGSSHPRPVRTLAPSPEISIAAVVGATMYFSANDGSVGTELWKTDGTTAGTVRFKDIRPGFNSSNPQHLTAVGNTLYFTADDGTHGIQLWRTDGTNAGTVMLTDIAGVAAAAAPVPLAALGSRLLFAAYAPDAGASPGGRELWVTDGTPAGTSLLKNINPAGASSPGAFGNGGPLVVVTNGVMYFAGTDAAHGRELWKTDGTPAGTVLVADVNPGAGYASPLNLTDVNGTIYFTGSSSDDGIDRTVFRTDPASGAVPIQKMFLLSTASTGSIGGKFYMVGLANNATALFTHDPASPAGTGLTLVKQFGPATTLENDVGPIVRSGGTGLFLMQGAAGQNTIHLWRTNGTAAGTVELASFQDQPIPDFNEWARWHLTSGPSGMFYFAARVPGAETELFRTNGSASGTRRVLDPNTANGAEGGVLFVQGPSGVRGLFAGDEREHGRELWITDGTSAGTRLLKDINPGPADGIRSASDVRDGKVLTFSPDINGRLYFRAQTPEAGIELWTSDGTEAGTRLVKDLIPGRGDSNVSNVFPFRGSAHFFLGNQLWRTDGTEAGTTGVAELELLLYRNSFVVGDTMYIQADRLSDDGLSRTPELWRTDGTQDGTTLVSVLNADEGVILFADTNRMVDLDGIVYFTGRRSRETSALWRSDGTAAGTYEVRELPSVAARPIKAAGKLFLEVGEENSPVPPTVWVSDGTGEGTVPLSSVVPHAAEATGVPQLFEAGDIAYFFGRRPGGSVEVWRTDGTVPGTRRVKVIARSTGITAVPLNQADGNLYFRISGIEGPELWRTDGSDAGTVMVTDLRLGVTGANPANLTTGGGRVYFTANDGAHGMELWSMPLRPGAVAASSVFYNNSAFDGRDPSANAADLAAVAPDKAGLVPGQAASFANVTSYDKGINGVLVDVAGALPAGVNADDFVFQISRDGTTWSPAPAPASVALLPGPVGADLNRYAITWPDRAIRNTWLRVTVLANGRTGLPAPVVFSFGNLVGETGQSGGLAGWRVNAIDSLAVNRGRTTRSSLTSTTDINRDGRTNATDMALVRMNQNRTLIRLAAEPTPVRTAASRRGRIAEEISLAGQTAT
jgi:ELWxxDGT repeat protein